jgi:DNA-binding transcriptional ArsR family regulator
MARNSGMRALAASAPLFGALGDPTRLGLVARLCEQGPLSITRLTAGTDVTRQAITRHLRVLAKAGVVRGTRDVTGARVSGSFSHDVWRRHSGAWIRSRSNGTARSIGLRLSSKSDPALPQ